MSGQVGSPGNRNASPWQNFNGTFLAFTIVSAAISVAFLLYFNRLLAFIVSRIIRTITWRRWQVYIDIQALQVSPLAGRIFFTGLRYHGNNETILIQHGHITWSYWLRRVRHVDLGSPQATSGLRDDSPTDTNPRSKLPCRINVSLAGLEWFVYNRSAAYNTMLDAMMDRLGEDAISIDGSEGLANGSVRPRHTKQEPKSPDVARPPFSNDSKEKSTSQPSAGSRAASRSSVAASSETSTDGSQLPMTLQLFPINILCNKAALVMGNENTKAVLIMKAKSLLGDVDAAGCQTPDPYRQLFKFRFEQPVVEMKENPDYKESQMDKAVKDKQAALNSTPVHPRPFFRRQRRKVLGHLKNLVPYWRSSVESFSVGSGDVPVNPIPGSNRWQGLTRYLNDDDEDDKLRWSSVEYAAVNPVVDSPEATLTILWDVPGKVTDDDSLETSPSGIDDHLRHINGSEAPAWAINLSMKGGMINYGPWADRHRAEIQQVFFPGIRKDAKPAERVLVGADRVPTSFKFYVEIDEEVTLRVPTRESSKNWRWKKEMESLGQQRKQAQRDAGRNREAMPNAPAQQRPYGWLDIKVAANATVSYNMDMLASSTGYKNKMQIDLPSTEVSTSINHGLLWKSGAQRISCDLSTPLKWNSLRNWRFDIDSESLELFLLREHTFLIIDLVDDWGSGPPAEYLVFTPFKYWLNLELRNTKIYLNVNDVNIVNSPTDFDDNTYIILSTPCLTTDTCISLDSYRPTRNSVPFQVRAETLDLGLHLPPWNTQATFMTSKDIGHLENLAVVGRYHYHATTSPANTDTLVLDVSGQSPLVSLHGFLVRYFLQLKDNYFGDHVHFKTLDEYQEQLREEERDPDAASANKPPHKKSNDLDVMLNIRADDPKVLLPANLYSAQRHTAIETASLTIDLRFTSYNMDLELCLPPLTLSIGDQGDSPMTASTSAPQLFVDGLNIYGHRLFGLPPSEPTYLCNWDLALGAVSGECNVDFLTALMGGAKALGFSLDDDENALIPYSSIVMYDITFLRVFVQSVKIWVRVDETALLVSTGSIDVNYNDWARTHYSRRANIEIPDIEIACASTELLRSHKTRAQHPIQTEALVRTSIRFALVGRKPDFAHARKLQQELVRRHDQRTNRTAFLKIPIPVDDLVPEAIDPPAQSVPAVPQPINLDSLPYDESRSFVSSTKSSIPQKLRHKSSFLSSSSSSRSMKRHGLEKSRRRSGQRNHSANGLQQNSSFLKDPHKHDVGSPRDGQRGVKAPISFSSPYYPPQFPLAGLHPDSKEVLSNSVGADEQAEPGGAAQFGLEDIHPDLLNQDHAQQSFLVELHRGISVFISSKSLPHVASLLDALQPTHPEDIIDNLQIGAMSDIFAADKKKKIAGTMTDLVLRIPEASIRFLNCCHADSSHSVLAQQDEFDLTLRTLALATRSETSHAKEDAARASRKYFHLRLSSASLNVSERLPDSHQIHAAFAVNVENVIVSLGSRDITYVDADIGAVRSSISSHKINYLGSMIQRANALATQMGPLFQTTASKADRRLKAFTYLVVTRGQYTSDPSFIVRPSAVLRAADEHLRTRDSWKIASRLRYMWFQLSRGSKEDMLAKCTDPPELPNDVRSQVIASFERWRSWDLENLANSVFLQNVFGKQPGSIPDTGSSPRLMVAGRLQQAQFALDPGPKQNELFLVEMTLRLEEKERNDEQLPTGADASKRPLTVVSLYCGEAGVHLNWELCEVADHALALLETGNPGENTNLQKSQAGSLNGSEPARSSKSLPADIGRDFHVVALLALGSVSLETVNISIDSQVRDMKISVLRTTNENNSSGDTVVLSCDSTMSRFRNGPQSLATFRLKKPSILAAQELQAEGGTPARMIKSTASCDDLRFTVKQDPIVLSEVVGLVVRDEVTIIHEMMQRMPQTPSKSTDSKPAKSNALRFDIAMFLHSYTIDLPLLRSLTYTISGNVARATVAGEMGRYIVYDFDIGRNSHDMQMRVNNIARSISILEIPPANGRVTSRMTSEANSITVYASVDLIQLDASAVYSLLKALNRPEISSALDELSQQVKLIQEYLQELSGPSKKTEPKVSRSKSTQLIYVVHGTLAGLKVFATSPLNSESDPFARVTFCLGKVHLEIANKLAQGPVLENPEVQVNVHEILFNIEKGSLAGMRSCGNLGFGALITATSRESDDGTELRSFDFKSDAFEVNLSSDTISTIVDVLGYMGDKIKDLDTSREIEYLRKLRQSRPRITINDTEDRGEESDFIDSFLGSIMYSFQVSNIQISWLVSSETTQAAAAREDLVLSLSRFEFGTRKARTAKLTIEGLQLQMVPPGQDKLYRSLNSALLPEMMFNIGYVSTANGRRLAFQAVGKSLDLRLTSGFIIPAAYVQDSISLSMKNVQQASANWTPLVPPPKPSEKSTEHPNSDPPAPRRSLFGSKRLESLLVDADFAGAVVHLSGKKSLEERFVSKSGRPPVAGKYGQFKTDEAGSSTTLKTPGLAWKTEYRDNGQDDPTLYGEIKVEPSRNILYPSVVPLILEITNSIKEVVRDDTPDSPTSPVSPTSANPTKNVPPNKATSENAGEEDENILTADPSAVLGRMRLNLGLRICQQEFTLSCQPIGRVAATTSFEDIYITVNTVHSAEHGNFFALSGTFSKFNTAVRHVYSRESTANFKVDSIVLSLMNSKHVSGTPGVSAILKVSPMEVLINARQLQDFLLFREIWIPSEIRQPPAVPVQPEVPDTPQGVLMQKYQQVAATAAFPWTATISITALNVTLELGQSLGTSVFAIKEFWISSKKTSDWEQNLCLGFQEIGINSTGRLSGFIELHRFKLRTSIEWPDREQALNETPRVQASLGFSQFRLKMAFDYQAFLVADIISMEFLMYNVRRERGAKGDRLVAILDGSAVQVFGTTASASQSIALWQAIQKLIKERKESYKASLQDIEKFMRRRSSAKQSHNPSSPQISPKKLESDPREGKGLSPISLDTDVVVTLKALNLGVFPSTFSDHQVFKLEALNAQARFSATAANARIHSILGLMLGQLRIGLAGVRGVEVPKVFNEMAVEDVVASATGSRGGTILKVPKVEAVMQTWQTAESRAIEYIFKSAFEGKVEVGWNYSRIASIRNMWATHSKLLAQTWGRELPTMTAIKVTGVLPRESDKAKEAALNRQKQSAQDGKMKASTAIPSSSSSTTNGQPQTTSQQEQQAQQQKITAEVHVPQSKYEYVALEPPIIETPQLRDMGEATPPLEWIGLHRDRLPNLTHQIVIVALLELAGEVEDAYGKILGST